MKKELQKTFQIPDSLKIDKMKETGKRKTIIYCSVRRQKVSCKHCGSETSGYDTKINRKRHTVFGGKIIWLEITKRRFRCKKCKRVFVEPIKGLSRSQFTDHMVQQIQEKTRGKDLTTVANEMGTSISTVSRKIQDLPIPRFRILKKKN